MAEAGALRQRLRALLLIAWIACLLLIVAASLLPPTGLPVRVGASDKLWHAAGYALAMLLAVPLWHRLGMLLGVAVGLATLGAVLELLQGYSGYRSAELADALANSAGVLGALLAVATPLRGIVAAHDPDPARRIRFHSRRRPENGPSQAED